MEAIKMEYYEGLFLLTGMFVWFVIAFLLVGSLIAALIKGIIKIIKGYRK